jgi:hypothetical protein
VTIAFTLPTCDTQKSRPVRQQLWPRVVEIADGKRGRLSVTAIVAREIGAPDGVKPTSLYTTLEGADFT